MALSDSRFNYKMKICLVNMDNVFSCRILCNWVSVDMDISSQLLAPFAFLLSVSYLNVKLDFSEIKSVQYFETNLLLYNLKLTL